MLALPHDDVHLLRARVSFELPLPRHRRRAGDGPQRIPQLVTDQRQEIALALARFGRRFVGRPQLPGGRRELGEHADDAFVLGVELAGLGVADDPDRADRRALMVERNQERFDAVGVRRQRGKASMRQTHQLGGVLIDADAAGARRARHRSAACAGHDASHRFPAEDIAIEQADARRFGVAEIGRDLHEFLQHVARIGRHLAREDGERAILLLVVRRPAGPRPQLRSNIDIGERRGGRSADRWIKPRGPRRRGVSGMGTSAPRRPDIALSWRLLEFETFNATLAPRLLPVKPRRWRIECASR